MCSSVFPAVNFEKLKYQDKNEILLGRVSHFGAQSFASLLAGALVEYFLQGINQLRHWYIL